jgi:hypothetical protein
LASTGYSGPEATGACAAAALLATAGALADAAPGNAIGPTLCDVYHQYAAAPMARAMRRSKTTSPQRDDRRGGLRLA